MSVNFNKSHFPSDWNDDVRMNFLFSIFREKSVNPEGWEAKMNFWNALIQELCYKHTVPLVTHSTLCSALERKGRFPQCLDVVLDNMLSQGLLMNMSEFSIVEPERGWVGWGFNILIQKPVFWGFSTVQSLLNWSKKDERLIVMSVVKDLAQRILQRYYELANAGETVNIVYLDCFEEECKDICTGENFNLAIIQLQRDRQVYVFEDCGKKIIKFRRPGEKKVERLTELDKGILGLQKARDSILDDIDKIEEDIKSSTEEARQFVKSGCKTKAMHVLKRRKRLETILKKKSGELDNVENLLIQLQNTGSEKMILDAYKAGIQAMKASVKKDLDLEKIDTTMSEVEEMVDDYNEIQRTLSKSVSPDESLDLLEEELNEILKTDQPSKRPEMKRPSPSRISDDEIVRRLAALRTPPEGIPPIKKPAVHEPLSE